MLKLPRKNILYQTPKAYLVRTRGFYYWKFWIPKTFCHFEGDELIMEPAEYCTFTLMRGQRGEEVKKKVGILGLTELFQTKEDKYKDFDDVVNHVPQPKEAIKVEVPDELKR